MTLCKSVFIHIQYPCACACFCKLHSATLKPQVKYQAQMYIPFRQSHLKRRVLSELVSSKCWLPSR